MDLKAQLDMQDVKSLLNLFGDEKFFVLFQRTLEVYRSTSITGVSQTLEEIDFKIHKRLSNLESPYSEEFEQLGTVNNFVEELQKELRTHQTTTYSSNQVLAQPDDHSIEIEILEESKHQSPVVPPVTQTKLNVQAQPYTPRGKKRVTYAKVAASSGSGSDDSRPMSPLVL
ncbi:unnamed protein product [Rhizophagus irregularis]|nr:unnamed protein product [Rhizophagus irregularis]